MILNKHIADEMATKPIISQGTNEPKNYTVLTAFLHTDQHKDPKMNLQYLISVIKPTHANKKAILSYLLVGGIKEALEKFPKIQYITTAPINEFLLKCPTPLTTNNL